MQENHRGAEITKERLEEMTRGGRQLERIVLINMTPAVSAHKTNPDPLAVAGNQDLAGPLVVADTLP